MVRDGRFRFGENWRRFVELVSEERIEAAETSLTSMLSVSDFRGKSFLDIGSGSGLFSLAARNLGARVVSFDYDTDSVKRPDDDSWKIGQGDVLDRSYMCGLGQFDIVYSWGVLHHTGEMWNAIDNAAQRVAPGGHLFIALYNDQRWLSKYWLRVKQYYNSNIISRVAIVVVHAPYFLARSFARYLLFPKSKLQRGMDMWRDVIDWLGGYPFEVTRPEAVLDFCRTRGFELERLTTVDGRHGCNEFVFRKVLKQAIV
jgi:2-polyprenyl-6-hydroxyphenyl methylase/3-demethylubiquinone-9 3-methyltransferase